MVLPDRYSGAHQFAFGDSPELADELLALVLAGKKTATCGALRDHEAGEPMPQVGRQDVVLDGRGQPACVIETTAVEIVPFDAVTADFAEAEGEGPYDAWREGHIAFFGRNGGWDGQMKLVCERFALVEVLDRT
tara:strand:- start:5213 stop:5614 length:402 start_codon:yes stop_codon:yes gene_type:complete